MTGALASAMVERLVEQRRAVRVLTRDTARAVRWSGRDVELVTGDLRDRESLRRACHGATHVITTANAFPGRRSESVANVDRQGNRTLIDAARAAAVRHFVFTSALAPDSYQAIDFFAAKLETEKYLRHSGLGSGLSISARPIRPGDRRTVL